VAFLRKTTEGSPAVTVYDATANEKVNYAVVAGVAQDTAASATFVFDESTGKLYFPGGASPIVTLAASDMVEMVFAADKYASTMNTYFTAATGDNSDVGALRQGQVEVFIVDGSNESAMWRLTGCTISADLTREPLTQLGNLGPYDRPLTLPIPITVTVDSTAGDLENWAKLAGQDYTAIDDIDLNDLMTKDDLTLVVKVFEQTDEEAGGNGSSRKVNVANVVGNTPIQDGTFGSAYIVTDTEYAMKTIVVKNLKITDEGSTLDVGANATQTFGFRTTNDLFIVKGDLTDSLTAGLVRNSS